MKRKFTLLIAALALLTMMASTGTALGQSDYSSDYTGNITLSTAGGTNASDCVIAISGTNYAGIKAGTSSKVGAVVVTVPSGTKYLHIHAAAWNGTTASLAVTPDGYSENIALTANSGIANNSPFTFNGDPSTSDYYKVITFSDALTANTNLTFTAVGGKRFVIWGVTSEEAGSSTTPSITASNVDIAYDATNGSIAYEINNPVNGGALTATTTAEWLTLGTVDETTVPFTCGVNPAATERAATVTLTYTYNTDQTVTKNVTVTQAGNPNVVDNIEDITATGSYIVQGTIVAISNRGFILGDGTGYVYYYYGSSGFTPSNYAIGDKKKLSGSVTVYGGVYQFGSSTTITTVETSNYTPKNPTILTGTQMDTRVASTTPPQLSDYIQYQGKLSVSGTYYNITDIEGATTAKGSISYPTNTDFTSLNGKTVTVTGYYVGISSSTYYNTMIGSIEEVETEVAAPTFSPAAGTYATTQEVTISCETDGATIYYTTDGTEPTSASTVYSSAISVESTTTIKAIAIKNSDASTVATANYYICSQENPYTVTEALAFAEYQYPANGIYVHGIVSTAPTAAPNNGQLTYYISVDGEASNQLQVYKGKGLNNTSFTAQTDIQVGDIVTIYGNVKIYNSTKEFDAGNYLVSFYREPVLATQDVNIACDVTAGVINYTVTNPASDGNLTAAITAGNEGGWLTLGTVDSDIPFTCTANTGAERTATVTLTYTYNSTETVTAEAVVTQAAYVVPTASIVVTPTEVNATADETEGTITVTLTAIEDDNIEIVWFESDGETQATEPAWITAEVNVNNNIDYLIEENTGDARTAYFKVYGLDGDANDVYSELITINQAAPVADYATLPFEWVGSSTNGSSSLTSMNGVTASGLGSDYAASNAPYRIKLDGTGDYIQIKTNEQPGLVTLEVKMLGGAETSYITVQGSTDGETFDQGEALEISGAQNTELTLTSTRTFDEDVRYVRMVFTKGSNVGVGSITIEKYVVKYTVNLNQPLNNEGTIAADKEEAAEGETVTLTATPNTGYAFDSWTVLDEDAQEVTVINNAFEMPASDVEVEATFTALPKHNIIIPAEIENNVIVDATGNQAYATETVTITVDAPANKVLATLTVTGNTSSGIITITPEVSPYVEEYTFTMPEEDVTINATFTDAPTFTVSFSVNGTIDEDLELSVTQGQGTQLPTISTLTPEGFSITGWSESNNSTEAVADPYTPTENITLYAILGQTMPHSLAINASTPNFPKSYGPANTFTEYNLAGKNFMIQQGYKNGSILQWRASGNSNGTGTMYNREDLGKINTIILVYDQTDGKKNFTIKAGTTENPTGGTEIVPTINNLIYTFDLSQGDYNYFVMTNGTGAGYLQSISIDYELDLNINTVTTITSPTASMSTDIPATTCVIVKDGAVLTFTGQNDGTADNLIIEDGGQLIVNNSVAATVEKTIQASGSWGSKDGGVDGWDLISSPIGTVNTADVTNLTPAPVGTALQYDLYSYNEASKTWYNQQGTEHQFTQLMVGEGYLYSRKENADLGFAGEVSSASITKALTYTEANGTLAGWNLVGNPYTHNITWANLEPTNVVTTGYYTLGYDGQWSAEPSTTTVIKPMQGFLVKANALDAKIVFNNTASSKSRANRDYLAFTVANNQYEDVAYAMFEEATGLSKINHRNADIPMVYIPQDGQNYAIATMDDNTQAFELNFKAMTTGQYTLSYKAEGKYSYLHVIDRLTGEDIDMLLDGEYSFIGSPRDNEARFIVKLSYNANIEEIEVNDNFAYQNGSDIIVNGNGELQVFDVTGRMVMNTKINGIQTVNVPATGMYIFRMVGESVQTQKIVVR